MDRAICITEDEIREGAADIGGNIDAHGLGPGGA